MSRDRVGPVLPLGSHVSVRREARRQWGGRLVRRSKGGTESRGEWFAWEAIVLLVRMHQVGTVRRAAELIAHFYDMAGGGRRYEALPP